VRADALRFVRMHARICVDASIYPRGNFKTDATVRLSHRRPSNHRPRPSVHPSVRPSSFVRLTTLLLPCLRMLWTTWPSCQHSWLSMQTTVLKHCESRVVQTPARTTRPLRPIDLYAHPTRKYSSIFEHIQVYLSIFKYIWAYSSIFEVFLKNIQRICPVCLVRTKRNG
jgi:hypothetical protein